MMLRKELLGSTALNLSSSIEAREELQRRSGERQATARDVLRATAATTPSGDVDLAVRVNHYLSLLPGF
jgi:hypothetical protein